MAPAPRRAVALLALAARPGLADIDNVFPVLYVNNPVARHVACATPAGTATVCPLAFFDNMSRPLNVLISSLPATGGVYETSQNYRTYGTLPVYAPAPIQDFQLPYQVNDPLSRIVYVPPSDIFPPEGQWSSLTYTVQEPLSGVMSMPAQVSFSSPDGSVGASSFIADQDGWTISGNIHSTTPTWEPFGWGRLNRYIYSTDEVQYTDFVTGSDRSRWYFEAPAGKFYLPELACAYGGYVKFTIASTFGDFTHLNSPLDFITLECASCNSGRGMRLVRFADNGLQWNGTEQVFQVPLTAGNFWRRDPMNTALPFTDAKECEIAAVLGGLTRFRILGDFTKGGEGIALDDVSIASGPRQPAFPTACQAGCPCAHDMRFSRISCCGSSPDMYYPIK